MNWRIPIQNISRKLSLIVELAGSAEEACATRIHTGTCPGSKPPVLYCSFNKVRAEESRNYFIFNLRRKPNTNTNTNTNNIVPNQNERALFRMSTEGILPTWLPIPAFSFEVVRRFPAGTDGDGTQQQQEQEQPAVANDNNEEGPSFWRRLMLLVGLAQISPEEEAIAIMQLVEVFPQYDRAELLRELRYYGSAESVTESILNGEFTLTEVVQDNQLQEGTQPQPMVH